MCLVHTWQRQSETPAHELQLLGDWKTATMVERYAHLAPEHLTHAASRIKNIFDDYDLATVEQKEKRAPSLEPV